METFAEHYQSMMDTIQRCMPGADLEIIDRAVEFAREKHKNQVRRDGSPYIIGATIRAYYDEHVLTTSSDVCCLTNDFTYRDYIDTVERAQAPLIGPDQDVVVAIYDSRTKTAFAPAIVHTAPRVSRQCSTPLSFVDADMTLYLRAAGFKVGEENENG